MDFESLQKDAEKYADSVFSNAILKHIKAPVSDIDPKIMERVYAFYKELIVLGYKQGAWVAKQKRSERIDALLCWGVIAILIFLGMANLRNRDYFTGIWSIAWSGVLVFMRCREMKNKV